MTPDRTGYGAARAAVAVAVALGGLASMTGSSRAGGISEATEALLRSSSYVYVATQRKDGTLSEAAPIWFVYDAGRLFFTTSPGSWKARRIARGSPLTIHVGTRSGPTLLGKATTVTDPALIERMGRSYGEKYWIARLGLFRPRSERVTAGKTVAYSVEIEEQ